MRRRVCGVLVLCGSVLIAPVATAQVLRVGTYNGIPGQYSSIQAAVNDAQPGNTILVAPGDYKTNASSAPPGASDTPAAVLITTPGITLRGMDRNTVVMDGTKRARRSAARRPPTRTSGPTARASTGSWSGRPPTCRSRT